MSDSSNSQQVPAEIKKWNWGAFMFNMFWGVGNKTYLPLLTIIPVFNIVWMFFCGALGNGWAWKKGDYANTPEGIAEFKKVQASWNRAGIFAFIIAMIGLIFVLINVGIAISAWQQISPNN